MIKQDIQVFPITGKQKLQIEKAAHDAHNTSRWCSPKDNTPEETPEEAKTRKALDFYRLNNPYKKLMTEITGLPPEYWFSIASNGLYIVAQENYNI